MKIILRGAACAAAALALPLQANAQSETANSGATSGPVILFAPGNGYDSVRPHDDDERDGEGLALISLGIRNSATGTTKTVGLSIGYDFGVGKRVLSRDERTRRRNAFIGLGLAVDTDISSSGEGGEEIEEVLILNRIFGTNLTGVAAEKKPDVSISLRAGTWLGEKNKAYVLGGVGLRNQDLFYGVGIEHSFGAFVASAEYRYLTKEHANAISIGGGFRF